MSTLADFTYFARASTFKRDIPIKFLKVCLPGLGRDVTSSVAELFLWEFDVMCQKKDETLDLIT